MEGWGFLDAGDQAPQPARLISPSACTLMRARHLQSRFAEHFRQWAFTPIAPVFQTTKT
ncbi:hypothetical protein SynRS9909_02095 [Synechococcus sp. RS9909]|nr:hypothetical protein SynRS9909_02095 [Synechococcus sp. RS9909]